MCPFIEIGRLHLSSYGMFHVFGTLMAGMLFFHLLVLEGIPAGKIRKIFPILFCSGLVGALTPGLISALVFRNSGWGGLSSIGCLFGLGPGTLIAARFLSLEPGVLFDRGAVITPLWLGIGRIGCAMAGCCYGRPAAGHLAFMLPDIHGNSCSRYPTQLMSATADFLLFAMLFMLLSRQRYESSWAARSRGRLVWVFLAGYALKRLVLDGLRGDLVPLFAGLSLNQLFGLAYLLLILPLLFFLSSRRA